MVYAKKGKANALNKRIVIVQVFSMKFTFEAYGFFLHMHANDLSPPANATRISTSKHIATYDLKNLPIPADESNSMKLIDINYGV